MIKTINKLGREVPRTDKWKLKHYLQLKLYLLVQY